MMLPPGEPATVDLAALLRLRRELVADGLTDNQIKRLVNTKVLHRVRHGAYARADDWDALSREDQHRLLCRAVLRTADSATVLSHSSAIAEHGGPLWGVNWDVAHTTRREAGRAGRRAADWIQHRGRLSDDDIVEVGGVPVTRAARAALEFTTIHGVEASLVAVNGLLRSGAMTLDEFRAQVEEHRAWPNSLISDLVLRLADPRTDSVGEDRFLHLAFRQGLPRPTPQVEVYDEAGHLVGRVDFVWPEFGVFLEFDGRVKYDRFRREGEPLEQFLMREKSREELICQLTGWTCIRVSWRQLAHPELLAARIRKILAACAPKAS